MITVTFSQLILIYTALPLFILLLLWWFLGKRVEKVLSYKQDYNENLMECQFCANKYIDSKSDKLTKCPVCNSYSKK
jgi:hypothetical protein